MTLAVPPPVSPMLAKLARDLPVGDDWLYEPKWDGFRCLAFRKGGTIALQSKSGQPLDRYFPEMVEAFGALPLKTFVLDGRAPRLAPDAPATARPGETMRVAVRTDEDVILLSVRLGDGAPVPLRWDPVERRSVGVVRVPATLHGPQELFFEAVDSAKNRGFARRAVLVQR